MFSAVDEDRDLYNDSSQVGDLLFVVPDFLSYEYIAAHNSSRRNTVSTGDFALDDQTSRHACPFPSYSSSCPIKTRRIRDVGTTQLIAETSW